MKRDRSRTKTNRVLLSFSSGDKDQIGDCGLRQLNHPNPHEIRLTLSHRWNNLSYFKVANAILPFDIRQEGIFAADLVG